MGDERDPLYETYLFGRILHWVSNGKLLKYCAFQPACPNYLKRFHLSRERLLLLGTEVVVRLIGIRVQYGEESVGLRLEPLNLSQNILK